MFQTYVAATSPDQGPPRLARLRAELEARGLTGFLVPRSDAHQGEYVSPHDERLQWLTGFTGSAGFCVVLPDTAGVFIDGRYRLQVRDQIDLGTFRAVDWPETSAADWLRQHAPQQAVIGYDPWLHTPDEIGRIEAGLKGSTIALRALDTNPLDAVWTDQPPPARGLVREHPLSLAGRTGAEKRADLAQGLKRAGVAATVITLADSLAWLMNWRGSDIIRNPVVQGFAILHDDARLDLFIDAAKVAALPGDEGVTRHPIEAFADALKALNGVTRFDPQTAPVAVQTLLAQGAPGADPCLMAKATKNPAELEGMRAAHRRDGVAMVEFLAWFDAHALDGLSEIDMARTLEGFRAATGQLLDLSFDSISSTGPNAAINHYRVTEGSNRVLEPGDLFLIDSGGQYPDGTTDITRTLPVGPVAQDRRAAYTRVLQGMIAMSRARFPRGVSGGHLDALARYPLWLAGLDYDHGTGHGVGAALSVHEGPARLSRVSMLPLEPGMILSNEPGYYRAGGWGIRIENLLVVREAAPLGDDRRMLDFETITLCPIDTRLIERAMLSADEVRWLNAYHARVLAELGPAVSEFARDWLTQACAPI
ncbi:MAG: aminopeptidase P family protein [Rhodobacter sp.]|uniref:aminopeptidase P family protein n=1 Tax=Pararhodobacter sp. TaxID=2127056 RepID=UPI001DA48B61|nr:aminopeptidase P family protein [Pararhodobacter sp.]MCB1344176.1 aminopeptidase P family protein [Paracoccaceae bacterium]MCC0074188.1 aminopeptidase P family protein [Rhodobacter sp.]HPD93332.1 aminopeptidase P family protein [Pararhodobacter sp.]